MASETHVLIVEDDVPLRKAISSKLEKEGFSVISASNGKEGLDLALEYKPALILLDVVMPVLDGITMAQRLRQDVWGQHAQIIVMSNLNSLDAVEEGLEAGIFDYMVKVDWTLEQLVEKVRSKLSK